MKLSKSTYEKLARYIKNEARELEKYLFNYYLTIMENLKKFASSLIAFMMVATSTLSGLVHAQGALMGVVMGRVEADGGTVSRILGEELGKHLS